jgi:asparagine synthase (glutamine-hydrolysing)
MCGIAGVMMRDGRPLPDDVLTSLSNALAHRGPDERGELQRGDVGLIHTRLSIVDVAGGKQPFVFADGSALIANGEIYNDHDLRREFSEAEFTSDSDCESALHLYRARGETFTNGLRGMYALAIHNPAENKLILARDPFGIKPLYYAETPAGFFFTSEPQALIAAGLVTAAPNTAPRDEILALQFSTGTQTPFKNIYRVAPGETLIVQNGCIASRHIHPDALSAKVVARSDTDAVTEFEEVWRESVTVHQRADVPYGMFLSGGIDSAAVLAMMARLNESPVLAYTAAFPDTGAHDEREGARAAAKAAGARHIEVEVSAAEFWRNLPHMAAAVDDPTPDYALIPTYLLAKRAAQDVKVVLTGEGGDEMFAGYGRYRAALRPWPFNKRAFRRHILAKSEVLRTVPTHWRDGLSAVERSISHGDSSVLSAVQTVDCATWLPNDLLIKLDRCLMAHGVEGRVPFLDPRIAKFAFSLRDDQKVRGGLGKWIVRQWLAENFPAAAAFERKRGFTVPVAEWIANEGARLGPLVARQEGVAELCAPGKVEALFRNMTARNGHAAWVLLFYALWHHRHMLGRMPAGDVFETLSMPN